jgi:hypothetical protein
LVNLLRSGKEEDGGLTILDLFLTVNAVLSLSLLLVLTTDQTVVTNVEKYLLLFAVATPLAMVTIGREAIDFTHLRPAFGKRPLLPITLVPLGYVGVALSQLALLTLLPRLGVFTLNFVSLSDIYTPLVGKFFFANGGVIEEWIFTFYLLRWLMKRLKVQVVPELVVAVIFTVFHTLVYPGQISLLVVLVSKTAINFAYRASNKKLWVAELIHYLVNYTAIA